MSFKSPEGIGKVRNGKIMDIVEDESSIGHHEVARNPWMPFSTGDKMRRSGSPDQQKVFNNNGGESKADGAGTINKNGEYGPITTGF